MKKLSQVFWNCKLRVEKNNQEERQSYCINIVFNHYWTLSKKVYKFCGKFQSGSQNWVLLLRRNFSKNFFATKIIFFSLWLKNFRTSDGSFSAVPSKLLSSWPEYHLGKKGKNVFIFWTILGLWAKHFWFGKKYFSRVEKLYSACPVEFFDEVHFSLKKILINKRFLILREIFSEFWWLSFRQGC